jgi:hypothetical protein
MNDEMMTPSAPGASAAASQRSEERAPDFSCSFDGPWFGAGYPDAYCVDGYLHDADADGYIPSDATNPCPRCNTKTYLEYAFEEANGTEYLGWGTGAGMTYVTGDEIWEIAKRWARQENPDGADALIAELEKRNEPRGLSAAEEPCSERVTNIAPYEIYDPKGEEK